MNRAWILAAALASGIVPAAAVAADAPAKAQTKAKAAPLTAGEVKKVDREAKKLTIQHGPIENLGMPPMTMVFRVTDPAMLERVKAGDKVRFAVARVGGQFTLTRIERVD